MCNHYAQKSSKVILQSASIFLVVVLATSIMSTYIQSSMALGQEDEETAYLKFASQSDAVVIILVPYFLCISSILLFASLFHKVFVILSCS